MIIRSVLFLPFQHRTEIFSDHRRYFLTSSFNFCMRFLIFFQGYSLFSKTFGGNEGQISRRVAHATLIFFAVIFLQAAFQKYIFHCPSEHWIRFSYLAFFAPALPLFLIGWLSNRDLQDAIRGVFHGCWNRENRKRNRVRIRWRALLKTIVSSHLNAYVAPFCWFLMCLLNRKIMTCAVYGPEPSSKDVEVKKRYAFIFFLMYLLSNKF